MNDQTRKVILWALAAQAAVVGFWAAVLPGAFYTGFPGVGRSWVRPEGPYSEHLVRDVGILSAALAVVTAAAAVTSAPRPMVRAVAAGWLVYAVPHLAYHAAHRTNLPVVDQWTSLVLLALQVALPILLLLPRSGRVAGPDPAADDGAAARLSAELACRGDGGRASMDRHRSVVAAARGRTTAPGDPEPTSRARRRHGTAQLSMGPIDYVDVGTGPTLVFLHGVLMAGDVWDPVTDQLRREFRCILPTLPLGAHRAPMHPDADLTLAGFGRMVVEFLDRLDLHDVTLVGNDHAAVLAAAVQGSPRIRRLVVTSCEAFENYPPGLPGKNLRLTALLPGGLLGIAQLLRIRGLRRQPLTFGWLSKRPLPDVLVNEWLRPFQTDPGVRRDLRRYAAGARRRHMNDISARLADVTLPTLLIWTSEDRIQRRDHGARLAQIMPNTRLELVTDSYTLVMRDQPQRVSELVREFADRDRLMSPLREPDHAAAAAVPDRSGGSR